MYTNTPGFIKSPVFPNRPFQVFIEPALTSGFSNKYTLFPHRSKICNDRIAFTPAPKLSVKKSLMLSPFGEKTFGA